MSSLTIAVPSNAPGGMEATASHHFGHCDLYTIIQVDNGTVSEVTTMPNPPHQAGGCIAPIRHLAEKGVNVLLSGGMGKNPMLHCQQAGITVYFTQGVTTVSEAFQLFQGEKLPVFSSEFLCQGGTHCSHP